MNDASSMLSNFSQSIPGIVLFLNALFTATGLGLVVWALVIVTKNNAHGSQGHNGGMSVPLVMILCGVMLFNVTSSTNAVLGSIYGAGVDVSSLMDYEASDSLPSETQKMIQLVILIIRIFGYFIYYAGWMTVKNIPTSTDKSEGRKGLVRIVFGSCLINIVQSVNVVTSTIGFGDVL